jgi:hypothetical protein
MAGNLIHDELFTNAISGYREAFLVQHSHLSESERNELWIEQLSQCIPAANHRIERKPVGKRRASVCKPWRH